MQPRQNELRTKRKAAGSLPYEFRALESCLASVVTALDAEMNNIENIISELLEDLERHIGESSCSSRECLCRQVDR